MYPTSTIFGSINVTLTMVNDTWYEPVDKNYWPK